MSVAVIVVIWFLCGSVGLHLANAEDWRRHEVIRPGNGWYAWFGPIGLFSAIIYAITEAY